MNSKPFIVVMPPLVDMCPDCGAKYEAVQHPCKPPGVSITRRCRCTYRIMESPGRTLNEKIAPGFVEEEDADAITGQMSRRGG